MSPRPFTWTQPMGGKKVIWRPLKVGDRMDLDANYSRSDIAYQRKYAEYAMRIVSCEGVDGKFQIDNFRDWEDYDLEALAEEVVTQETLRANALATSRPGSPVERLEAAIGAAQIAANKLGEELRNVLAAAKTTERNLGPLVPPPST